MSTRTKMRHFFNQVNHWLKSFCFVIPKNSWLLWLKTHWFMAAYWALSFILLITIVTSIPSLVHAQQTKSAQDINLETKSGSSKKNVCSVTINSDHELKAFKKHLSADQWNFIELTDFQPERSNNETAWLQNSCEKRIQCDLLIVSGHFAGTFFGESELRLPIEELEMKTCDNKCDGIINKPKEVFLFGCNTLASKEKDLRTPEEYLQALLDDGFTTSQARQVVAFRYSAFGDSFKSRMSQIFTKTPRIYGFSSKGPSGKNVDGPLRNYLKSSKEDYLNFDLFAETTDKNEKLFTALKGAPLAQTSGISFIDQVRAQSERPYCYLNNQRISQKDKLKYIYQSLTSGQSLTFIPHIKKYISDLKSQSKTLTAEEKTILSQLKNNEKIMSDLNHILKLEDKIYFKIKMDIIVLMKDLFMISSSQYEDYVQKIINLQEPITLDHRDRVCSAGVQLDIEPEMIHPNNWENPDLYSVLGCLKPTNESILNKLSSILKNDRDPSVRTQAAATLGRIRPAQIIIQRTILDAMKGDKEASVRSKAAMALQDIRPQQPEFASVIADSLLKDKDPEVRENAARALGEIRSEQPEIIRALIKSLINDPYEIARSASAYALGELRLDQPEIITALNKALSTDDNKYVRYAVIKAFGKIKPSDKKVQATLVQIILDDNEDFSRTAIAALKNLKVYPEIMTFLKEQMSDSPNYELIKNYINQK